MLSFPAKLIDWCTIQLASRSFRPRGERPCPATSPLEIASLLHAPNTPDIGQLQCDAAGNFKFVSPVQTPSAENNVVVGRMFSPGAGVRRPHAVILLHGWNAELCYTKMFPRIAGMFNQVGITTVTMELPYHMHRRPRTGPVNDFISSNLATMLQATQQALADIQGLSRWLRAQGMQRVGIWGFSLGAWLTGLLARSEAALDCAVLTTPIVNIERAINELAFCAPVRVGLAQQRITLDPLNLASSGPVIASDRILLIESLYDLFAPAETVEELWRAWGQTQIWRLAHGHISILMSGSVTKRTVHWISERLSD